MRKETAQVLYFSILGFLITILVAFGARANPPPSSDTYNFYFQKAPGPTTVNQGNAPAPATPATPPAPTPTPASSAQPATGTSTTEVAAASTSEEPRWSLAPFYGRHQDEAYTSGYNMYGLQVGFQIVKVLGLTAGAFLPTKELARPPYSPGAGYDNSEFARDSNTRRAGWFAGLTFLPLQVRAREAIGFDLGITTGLMSLQRRIMKNSLMPGYPPYTYYEYKPTSELYAGPVLNVHFAKNAGLYAEAHFNNSKKHQYFGGMKFRF